MERKTTKRTSRENGRTTAIFSITRALAEYRTVAITNSTLL
jgi:hypothetical protein